MRRLSQILRSIWHGFFYLFMPKSFHRYALSCKEVVQQINTKKDSNVRMKLHLSLCQACSNYEHYSKWLRENVPTRKIEKKSAELPPKILERIKQEDQNN